MIVLPNTPPLIRFSKFKSGTLSPSLISTRASLTNTTVDDQNALIRYVVNSEQYIEDIFEFIRAKTNSSDISKIIEFASTFIISESEEVPWTNLNINGSESSKRRTNVLKPLSKSKEYYKWSLINEIEVILVSISLIYIRLGSELINELIDIDLDDESNAEINEKWKQVVNFYKKSISFTSFGLEISNMANSDRIRFNGMIYWFINKINDICIQMSILSKSSWINRNNYNETESFKTNNNGTLARVAIYILDELKNSQNILKDLQSSLDSINLDYTYWQEYLSIIEKYATAYAGLFLSIEYYQQDKVGQSIGLINFSLLVLQSKKFSEISTKQARMLTKFKDKISSKKNEQFINNLQSITTLDINNSVFKDTSSIVLKDLSFLFDQLIQLNLKFSKENNNLKFDKIADYQDIKKDSKWPLGCKIPVSSVITYQPLALMNESIKMESAGYSGRGAYY